MLIIEHRVNTIKALQEVPTSHGVEIDVRHNPTRDDLYLNHDPGVGESLEAYLKHFQHAFIIFNIKEAGIESRCIHLAEKYSISPHQYFLLDVEFPYLYRASRQEGVRQIAVRFSEAEPIEMAQAQKGFVEWLWIDTNTKLPVTEKEAKQIACFKTCLVGPDRWGRPNDLKDYLERLKALGIQLDAVMIGAEYTSMLSE